MVKCGVCRWAISGLNVGNRWVKCGLQMDNRGAVGGEYVSNRWVKCELDTS